MHIKPQGARQRSFITCYLKKVNKYGTSWFSASFFHSNNFLYWIQTLSISNCIPRGFASHSCLCGRACMDKIPQIKTPWKRLGHPKNPRKNISLELPQNHILFIKKQIPFKYSLQQEFSTSAFGVLQNVFAEVLAYKSVSINVIGYFLTISLFCRVLGETQWLRAREKVEDAHFSKDIANGSMICPFIPQDLERRKCMRLGWKELSSRSFSACPCSGLLFLG